MAVNHLSVVGCAVIATTTTCILYMQFLFFCLFLENLLVCWLLDYDTGSDGCCPIGYTAIELEKTAYEIQWSDELSKTTGCTTPHAKRTVLRGSDAHAHAVALPEGNVTFQYSFTDESGRVV